MATQTYTFGDFRPDLPDIGTQGVTLAKNVVPHLNSYLPFKGMSIDSTALTAYARGGVSLSDKDGNTEMYCGDATKLYRLVNSSGTLTWTSVGSSTYATGDENYWQFIKWGEKVIATNRDNNIQIANFGGGTFGDLGGSPPKAKQIAVVRGFIVLGDIDSGTEFVSRLQWSGLETETSWGTVPSTQADFQDLVGDGGKIMAIAGGDIGIVFQERSIWEMEYIGSPMVWRIKETAVGMGTAASRSVIRYGNSVFFLSQDGFMRYDIGGGLTPIGDKRIDQWFFERANNLKYHRITGIIDVPNAKAMWSYCNGDGEPDEILIYDWKTNNWSYAEVSHEMIFGGRGVGYTLDGLDAVSTSLDALPASLDADIWKGGQLAAYVFNTEHKSGTFGGSALTARLETGEIMSDDMDMLFLDRVRPLVEGATATNTVYLATRNTLNSDFTYGSGVTQNVIGEHNFRTPSRYIRLRLDIANGFEKAVGVRANLSTGGVR